MSQEAKAMRGLFLALLLCAPAIGDTNVYARRVVIFGSAQADADEMARTGILRHCGRNGGRREGIGCGPTPEAARRACCFFGQRPIVEEGVAYSPVRRQWFACIRYE
jgi:hypothetical protein